MSDHAIYSPSSATRWMNCTASAEAIAQLNENNEPGEEAKVGTLAHEELERCLIQNDSVDPYHPAAYGIALLLDFVRQLGPGRLFIEQRVKLTDDIWGRCDVAHWDSDGSVLTIIDLKNGLIDVQPTASQLKIYAAATIFTRNLPAKWIRLVVVQPNSIIPGPRVKQAIISPNELHAFAVRAAEIPHGPKTFTTGTHCRYCPLFGRCPASADLLLQVGNLLAYPAAQVPHAIMRNVLLCRRPIEDWFKAVDKAATAAARAGNVPNGMKLVKGKTNRTWNNPVAVRDFIFAQYGLAALDPPTPAQAEERLNMDVSALASKPEGPPVLAFSEDNRKTWSKPTANDMFGAALKGLNT